MSGLVDIWVSGPEFTTLVPLDCILLLWKEGVLVLKNGVNKGRQNICPAGNI